MTSSVETPAPSARVLEQRFRVQYEYPVVFTRGLFHKENPVFAQILARFGTSCPQISLVLDSGVATHWPALAEQVRQYGKNGICPFSLDATEGGAPLILQGGEASKNDPQVLDQLYSRFQSSGLDRHCFVLAIGGGAVLDVAGYAASTAHRGIRLLRVPTTVLGQNDSGVGVKNGVNAFHSKNFLGNFAPPAAVFNDSDFLTTLPKRETIAGMAEAVKVALIKDQNFFSWLEQNKDRLARFERPELERLVERTAELHLLHIRTSGDPFESGSSRPLDFGHWAAHKLESLTQHRLRHGEAVGIGMALDVRYAAAVGMLPEPEAERILSLISGLGLPVYHSALEELTPEGTPSYLQGLEEFRQHLGGQLSVTQLSHIGHGVQVNSMDLAQVEKARCWLKDYAQTSRA